MTDARGWNVYYFKSVTSTMDVAMHVAQRGASDRTVVISSEQTAGRGRGGRDWSSPPGRALYCTMLLRPRVDPNRLSTLPLLAGVAVAETIEALTGVAAQLKWPNDVWIGTDAQRRKIAGILMTSHVQGGVAEFVLVGIGINVAGDSEILPPGGTTILAATGVALDVDAVFNCLLSRFDLAYDHFLDVTGRPSLDGWRARAALLGEPVAITDAGRAVRGVFVGIDEDGALLLDEPGSGVRRVLAGDLIRGPRPAPQLRS